MSLSSFAVAFRTETLASNKYARTASQLCFHLLQKLASEHHQPLPILEGLLVTQNAIVVHR